MKLSIASLTIAAAASGLAVVSAGCTFANKRGTSSTQDMADMPEGHPAVLVDASHRRLQEGLPGLRGNPQARDRMASLLKERIHDDGPDLDQRRLEECVSESTYADLVADLRLISDELGRLSDPDLGGDPQDRSQGHFLGGIVRLAAHDFMDFHQNPSADLAGDPTGSSQGPDGCIDWNVGTTGADNAGLEEIWCTSYDTNSIAYETIDAGQYAGLCPLTELYAGKYAPLGISRADFWVMAASAVIKMTSRAWTDTSGTAHDDFDLPLRLGRVDLEDCAGISAHRLPGAQGCDQIQKTFVDQMGLTLTDATALLGAHSLGFGHAQFSGHHGMWVDEEVHAVTFDKHYYEELMLRAWRLRDPENSGGRNFVASEDPQTIVNQMSSMLATEKQDWTWGGGNGENARFMLNVDMCAIVDVDSITESCCSRIRSTNTPGETFCIDPRHGFGANTALQTTLVDSGVIQECPTPEDPSHPLNEAWVAAHNFVVTVPNNANNIPDADRNEFFYEAFAEAWQKATERGYSEGSLAPLAKSCVDHCAENDCVNGQCINVADTYECVCDQGWTGALCDENVDDCASSPCQNGGTCQDGINSHTCTCALGFDGGNCENNIDDCASSPCQNGGTCTDGDNSYTCTCAPGFDGGDCEVNINECASNPCQNDGVCTDGVNDYTCTCSAGYSGDNCEVDIDECVSNPCQNGGTCLDGVNSYTCTCAPGFDGGDCENNVNECDPNPCINGSCTDGVNSFTCSCNEGWMGTLCDEVVPDCVDVETLLDGSGRERDCAWVVQPRRNGSNRCREHAHLCPVSCGECDCLLDNRVCLDNGDCCTDFCDEGFCGCKRRGETCTESIECCSGDCRGDGTCGGNGGSF